MCQKQHFLVSKRATLTGPYFGLQGRQGAHMWWIQLYEKQQGGLTRLLHHRHPTGRTPSPRKGLVHALSLRQATLVGLTLTAKGLTCGRGRSMKSWEEVLHVSCSISTWQGKPPAHEKGVVHAFLGFKTIPKRSPMGSFWSEMR